MHPESVVLEFSVKPSLGKNHWLSSGLLVFILIRMTNSRQLWVWKYLAYHLSVDFDLMYTRTTQTIGLHSSQSIRVNVCMCTCRLHY